MSTKTTFKRIALVAVAALGLGVLSVAPSSAVVNSDLLSVSSATAAQTTAETATATSATTTIAFLAGAVNDSMTVTASLVSGPATSTALPHLRLVETASASLDTITAPFTSGIGFNVAPNTATRVSNTTSGAAQVSAKFQVYLGTDSYTAPSVAGTYVVKLTPALSHTTTGGGNATAQTITITVTKAASQDTVAASAYTHLTMGEATTPVPALAATDSTVSNSKDLVSTTNAGTLGVKLLNAAGVETTSESFSVTITGAGILGSGATINTIAPVGRSIIVKANDSVGIFADGTAGVGTVTVSSAAGKVLATKTVTFYGAPAAIVLSARRDLAPNSVAAADVMRAQVFDALGYPVNGAVVYATSSDQTTIAADYVSYTTADVTSAGVTTSGLARIALTGVKLGTAKITVGLAKSATDVTTTGYAIKSDPLTIKVAGGLSQQGGVIVAMDKQTYTPGSYAWVTITPVDAAGVKLAPETYTVFSSTGITASQPVESSTAGVTGSTIWGATVYTATSSNASTRTVADPVVELDGTKIQKIKLPNTEGDFTISWTTAAAANFPGNIAAGGVAGSVTVTLSNPGSQAAVDAAAEATDAANAATDAALAAADAADAATAAAEDASAAVATLAKQVNTALGNLKKQITALTALVNKLLKK
jgi:hypothetical protein